jgi:C-terminal processing protease CtpA/Prc
MFGGLFAGISAWSAAPAAKFDAAARMGDMDWLIDQLETHYAYLPERHLDLARMRAFYRQEAKVASTHEAWVHALEHAIAELHDHHATLGTNTPASPQLIPTGTDLWAEMSKGHAIIEEVRPGSLAEKVGLQAGDQVLAIGGTAATKTVARAMPKALSSPDAEAANFALRTLLAGTHDANRILTIRDRSGRVRNVSLPPAGAEGGNSPLSWRKLSGDIGYIRFANSLGDTATVPAFDEALLKLRGVKSLIVDLRDTPSGGNTDVAEPMLGRFTARTAAYQRVFDPGAGRRFPRDSWLKQVAPRGPFTVTANVIVLADHWTGSMGEGMAIGLNAFDHAQIVGTTMARLSGGTGEFVLPNTRVPVRFPVERLYHVNGTPREKFMPTVPVDLTESSPREDAILMRAIAVAATKSKPRSGRKPLAVAPAARPEGRPHRCGN